MTKIELEGVRKQFDSKVAVADVSIRIPQGSIFGLLGPNGAGKTTMIRMIMDIIKPDAGTIRFEGRTITDEDKDRISYLPEERGLYRKQKVQEILEYFARLKGLHGSEARRRASSMLARLEMTETAPRKVEELSKGNQQKIQIAACLVSDPDVIILDEPFSGLDPLNVQLIKGVIVEERRAGKTILFSTHQMNQVEELCDHLMMINQGRRVLYGSLEEIMSRYAEPAILLECPSFDAELPEIERVIPNEKHYKVFPKAGVTTTALLQAILARGIDIEGFRKARTPLEQIFIRVAQESQS